MQALMVCHVQTLRPGAGYQTKSYRCLWCVHYGTAERSKDHKQRRWRVAYFMKLDDLDFSEKPRAEYCTTSSIRMMQIMRWTAVSSSTPSRPGVVRSYSSTTATAARVRVELVDDGQTGAALRGGATGAQSGGAVDVGILLRSICLRVLALYGAMTQNHRNTFFEFVEAKNIWRVPQPQPAQRMALVEQMR